MRNRCEAYPGLNSKRAGGMKGVGSQIRTLSSGNKEEGKCKRRGGQECLFPTISKGKGGGLHNNAYKNH